MKRSQIEIAPLDLRQGQVVLKARLTATVAHTFKPPNFNIKLKFIIYPAPSVLET